MLSNFKECGEISPLSLAMPYQLIKNSALYVFTNLLTQGLVFLLWILVGWWLDSSQIGLYALALFIIDFFSTIAILGLDDGITRFYYTRETTRTVGAHIGIAFLGSFLISSGLFVLALPLITATFGELSLLLPRYAILFIFLIFTQTATHLILVHYTALKKATTYVYLNILKGSIFCGVSIVAVYAERTITGILYALLISSLIIPLLFFYKERKLFKIPSISSILLKKIISYSFPLMLYSAVGIISGYFSRILLTRYTNLTTMGIFTFFLTLTLQINGVWSSLNRAWTPEIFSKLGDNQERTFAHITDMAFLLTFGYLVAMITAIIGGELFLFRAVLKPPYYQSINLFYILLLGPLFSGIYTAAYPLYYYQMNTKKIMLISVSLSLVNILITIPLIQRGQQKGATLSFIINSILGTLVYLYAFKKSAHIPLKIIRGTLWLACTLAVATTLLLYFNSVPLFLIGLVVTTVGMYYIGDLHSKKNLLRIFLAKGRLRLMRGLGKVSL